MEGVRHEVVISGMSGLFPESDNMDEFCENLFNKIDMVTTDNRRWPPGELGVPSATGKTKQRQFFDFGMFGINIRLAEIMDPNTKLSIEQAFRAVADSGISLKSLQGSNTGVFTSSFTSETEDLFLSEQDQGTYGLVAHSRTMQANRISFFLNFKGPSVALDATWNGGLEALQRGYDSIATGESIAAIVGSSSLLFAPHVSHHYLTMGRLSEDGTTRCFSDDANGYARSEGCVMFFLQRAEHALRSYGTIKGIRSGYFGSKKGPFTEFSQEKYTLLLKQVYAEAKVDPNDLAYVEANGDASRIVDARELNAISEVLVKGRKKPLKVGSVKSNVGHTEACSSMVSLAKVLITLDKGAIPPNLHYSTPNTLVPDLLSGKIEVVTEPTPIDGDYVGLSSVGMTGPYNHIILKRHNKPKTNTLQLGELPPDGLPRLVLLTDRNAENITNNKKRLDELPIDVEFNTLMNNFARDGVRNFLSRGYTVLNGTPNNYTHVDIFGAVKRPVWFLFSGMGSQWPGMAKSLMRLPIFAKAIQKCHDTLLCKGINLIDAVTNDDPKVFDNILNAFVGIAATQIGLVDVLRAAGVEPDGIIGHSLGEQGCGYADGGFTTEQMILSAYARGKASLDVVLVKGMMAAVGMGYQKIKDQLPGNVEVACHNSKDSCTLSGPEEEVAAFIDKLKSKGVFAKLVNVGDIAFHSKYMKPAGKILVEYLKEVIPEPKRRTSRWVSSSNPESKWDTELAQYCSAEYHANNMLSPVLFEEASGHIPAESIVIEIAPHALLQGIVKKSLPTCTHIPLTSKFDEDGLMFLLSALGKLYVAGVPVEVSNLYEPIEFPVSRNTRSIAPFVGWEHKEEFNYVRIKGDVVSCWKKLEINLRDEEHNRLLLHKLGGKYMLPFSYYLEVLIENFTEFKKAPGSPVVIENLVFENSCEPSLYSILDLSLKSQTGTGDFCYSDDTNKKLLCKGRILLHDVKVLDPLSCEVTLREDKADVEIDGASFCSLLKYQGLELQGAFDNVKKVYLRDNTIQAVVTWREHLMEFLNSVFLVVSFFEGRKSCEFLLLNAAKELIIDPSAFINVKNPDIVVEFNSETRILQCRGIRMILPQTKQPSISTVQEEPVHYSCEHPRFVPYDSPKIQSSSGLLELCTQLIVENSLFSDLATNSIKIASIGSSFETELTELVESPKYYGKLELNSYKTEKDFMEMDMSTLHQDVIWIVSASLSASTINAIESATKCFFLVPSEAATIRVDGLLEVSRIELSGKKFSLLTVKKEKSDKVYDIVKFDEAGLKSLDQKLAEANAKNVREDNECHLVVLLAQINSVSAVWQVMDETSSVISNPLFRYVIVDDSVLNLKSYDSQIQKDLKVNIKMNGVWGTLRPLESTSTEENTIFEDVYTRSSVYPISSVSQSKDVVALGLNLNDLTGYEDDRLLSVFDYTTTKNMGLATYDPIAKTLTKDEALQWKRPSSWTDAQAASVPLLYSLAAYIVHIANNTFAGNSILVNRALIPMSQAVINLALGEKLEVYVTVEGEAEKKAILKLFPRLKPENVFDCSRSTFHIEILQKTKGKGVYKVINTFTEDTMIEPCVKSTAIRGTYIQVSTAPMIKNSKMGMLFFDDEVVAMGATVEIMMNSSTATKIQIRDYLQNAISTGVVKPLESLTILQPHSSNTDAARIVRMVKSKVVVELKPASKEKSSVGMLVCDSALNYVIIGGQPQSDFWLKLTEWLLRRGARTINVVLHQTNIPSALSLRLSALSQAFPASRVHIHPAKQLATKASISHFLEDLQSSANICTMFLLGTAVKDNSSALNQVLQEKGINCRLVCLGKGAERLCDRRKSEGLQSLCVRCSSTVMETCSFLQRLDDLIIRSSRDTIVTLDRYAIQNGVYQEKSGSEWNHVPASLPELHELLRFTNPTPRFIEVQTQTPRLNQLREIDPVFFIPGLRLQQTRRLIQRLHFPALIAQLPSDVEDINFIASDLASQMAARPQNMYTIVADDWAGTLALHIAAKLQALGKITSVIMLDAAPATTRLWAAKILSDDFALFRKYVKLSPKVMSRLKECPTWETKVEAILESSINKEETQVTVSSLALLKVRLQGLLSAKPPANKLRYNCHLFRYGLVLKNDQCNLSEYLKRRVFIHLKDVDNAAAMIEQSLHDISELVLFEYEDAAVQPDEHEIGIGFYSDTYVTSAALGLAHKFLT